MLNDRYDNPLTTRSQSARDAYVEGVDSILSANGDGIGLLQGAVQADDSFALAHAALARALQISARGAEAVAAITKARALAAGISGRERGHINMLGHLIDGDGALAYAAALDHLAAFPRDALIAQPLTGVFGLIGFSGLSGREAEQLAFLAQLAPHYGEDWWFGTQFAFAQIEVGQADRALQTIECALERNPCSAHGAHVRAHIHYERGETEAGLAYLGEWRRDYQRRGVLYCHISWHVALWMLERGDAAAAWRIIDDCVRPGKVWGPPLNVLTDTASFLHRAELMGGAPQPERWREVSEFARQLFPKPGIAFADVHAALAHAMSGETDALAKLIAEPVGPAGEVVAALAQVFAAFARQDWTESIALLAPVMATHERIGGSRAQRDLLEFSLVAALLKAGRPDDARLTLISRRPKKVGARAVAGL